jgi:hypothetical protein
MGIRRFFDQDVIIKRLSTVSGHRKAFQSTATVEGCVQELSRGARQRLGILEERTWIAWFDVDTDIQEGDRIEDEDGVEYLVKEITTKDYGINQHKQVILEEPNE